MLHAVAESFMCCTSSARIFLVARVVYHQLSVIGALHLGQAVRLVAGWPLTPLSRYEAAWAADRFLCSAFYLINNEAGFVI